MLPSDGVTAPLYGVTAVTAPLGVLRRCPLWGSNCGNQTFLSLLLGTAGLVAFGADLTYDIHDAAGPPGRSSGAPTLPELWAEPAMRPLPVCDFGPSLPGPGSESCRLSGSRRRRPCGGAAAFNCQWGAVACCFCPGRGGQAGHIGCCHSVRQWPVPAGGRMRAAVGPGRLPPPCAMQPERSATADSAGHLHSSWCARCASCTVDALGSENRRRFDSHVSADAPKMQLMFASPASHLLM